MKVVGGQLVRLILPIIWVAIATVDSVAVAAFTTSAQPFASSSSLGARGDRSHLVVQHRTSNHLGCGPLAAAALPGRNCIEAENGDAHIFLRFSPLIGGPPFLPLHVEVIVAVEEDFSSKLVGQYSDTIFIRRVNTLSSIPFFRGSSTRLHRFDFLPEKPTDVATTVRLVSLRSVPGRVRYRQYRMRAGEPNDIQQPNFITDKSGSQQDGKGVTILIPVGYASHDNYKKTGINEVVSAAIQYKDECSETLFKELRILGGKNCLSFALDILSHMHSAASGIQKIPMASKFDFE